MQDAAGVLFLAACGRGCGAAIPSHSRRRRRPRQSRHRHPLWRPLRTSLVSTPPRLPRLLLGPPLEEERWCVRAHRPPIAAQKREGGEEGGWSPPSAHGPWARPPSPPRLAAQPDARGGNEEERREGGCSASTEDHRHRSQGRKQTRTRDRPLPCISAEERESTMIYASAKDIVTFPRSHSRLARRCYSAPWAHKCRIRDAVSVADTLTPHHPLSQLPYPRRKDRQWTAISVKSPLVSPSPPQSFIPF
jgi:hypothetical protein